MATIEIRNVGPIKATGEFDLKKVNVFIGRQSSGKSTIAKIISFCTWVEKDVATSQSLKTYQDDVKYFQKSLESFHKMRGYFGADSFISYKSDVVEILLQNEECVIKWVVKYAYKRSKIAYIPSERNMVILPEVRKVEFGNMNLRSFLFDWFDAREKYTGENRLPILDIGVDYYYSESNIAEEDRIHGVKNGKDYDVVLSNASSGLQSIVPLVVLVDYLTQYGTGKKSIMQEEKDRGVTTALYEAMVVKPYFSITSYQDIIDELKKWEEINVKQREGDADVITLVLDWQDQIKQLFNTQNTQFIIEEPEQNLFPKTQKELIYHFLGKCFEREDNRLTMTTHSPYILYALNNCMLGYLVKDKMLSDGEGTELKSLQSAINPQDVAVWQITDDGTIKRIQGEDYLIGKNALDACMKEVMDDFYTMIDYYGDEEQS